MKNGWEVMNLALSLMISHQVTLVMSTMIHKMRTIVTKKWRGNYLVNMVLLVKIGTIKELVRTILLERN